jgi:hypothetical protein
MRAFVLVASIVASGCTASGPTAPEESVKAAETAAPAEAGERQFTPPPGFKPRMFGRDLYYCRKMPVLGSRFPQEVCMTEAEIRERIYANDAIGRDKDTQGRICQGPCGPQ